MEILGYEFVANNAIGYISLISFLFLFILYFMRPKPFRKIIPSIIFLESGKRQMPIKALFKKFIKDWLIILQIFLLIILCLAALDVSTQVFLKRLNKEMVFVIDTSASSNAIYNGRPLIDYYKSVARSRVGISNTIVLINNNPEVLTKQTNLFASIGIISSVKPTHSTSNIWDAMMVAGDIAAPKSTVLVLSDFIDTNGRDLATAKNILEAKGLKVEFEYPQGYNPSNIGIINYFIDDTSVVFDVKNYDKNIREIRYEDQVIQLQPGKIEQLTKVLKPGLNTVQIETDDDFRLDDSLDIIVPSNSGKKILYLSNVKDTFFENALDAMTYLSVNKAEAPVIIVGDENLYIFNEVEYNALLPGTVDAIRNNIEKGSSLIILDQDDINSEKIESLLPVNILGVFEEDIEINNMATLDMYKDYNYGLSSKVHQTELKSNASIVLAEAKDNPTIVLSKYGQGNILYYGIFDDYNAFKLSTQYPLFWISSIDFLISRANTKSVNYKIGEIINADNIVTPDGSKIRDYVIIDLTGIYKVNNEEVAVNLLNSMESDLALTISTNAQAMEGFEKKDVEQTLVITPFFIVAAIILSLLEIYILKRRGDL